MEPIFTLSFLIIWPAMAVVVVVVVEARGAHVSRGAQIPRLAGLGDRGGIKHCSGISLPGTLFIFKLSPERLGYKTACPGKD